MATKCRRVAVLGAGVGGLCSIKSCLEEGMEVVCFESRPCAGGVWSGRKDDWSATGPSMYSCLVSNTSKSMTCFSDFPCPPDYPPFLSHEIYLEYVNSYAEHFRLLKYIQFNTRVMKVMRAADHKVTGRWRLTLKKVEGHGNEAGEGTEEIWEEEFDGVIVASGFYSTAKSPDYQGLHDTFEGEITHSCSYRNNKPFENKSVLVIGNVTSAGDIACDISQVAKQVYMSVGDGVNVISRVDGSSGLPFDLTISRALHVFLAPWVLGRMVVWALSRKCNHRTLGLLYTGHGNGSVMVNDVIQSRILSGKVKVIDRLSEFKATEVTTVEGHVIQGVDAVVFATGYDRNLSMLDESLNLGGDKLDLYKQVFPVKEKHHTLALVGCIRVTGPMPPVIELQSRLAAYTMSGRHKLPAPQVMQADSARYNGMARRPDGSHKYQFLNIMVYEELASEIGVSPSFWRLWAGGNAALAFKTLFGPAFPMVYRLVGPGAWEGAQQAIWRAVDENYLPLQGRKLPQEPKSLIGKFIKLFVLVTFVSALVFAWR